MLEERRSDKLVLELSPGQLNRGPTAEQRQEIPSQQASRFGAPLLQRQRFLDVLLDQTRDRIRALLLRPPLTHRLDVLLALLELGVLARVALHSFF
jgi:hypothetical protein